MDKSKYMILSLCMLLVLHIPIYASSYLQCDSVQNNLITYVDSVSVDDEFHPGYAGFNAIELAMMTRHRYSDRVQYSNAKFGSHLYFGVTSSIDKIVSRKDLKFRPAFSYGVILGKDITKNHSLSARFQFGEVDRKNSELDLRRYSLEINHHFNFSRYFWGYNPYRFLEFSSRLGAGYQWGEMDRRSRGAFYGLLGLVASMRFDNSLYFTISPQIALATEGYNVAPVGYTASRYNVSYGLSASLNYLFDNEIKHSKTLKDGMLLSKHYVYSGVGVNSLSTNIGFARSLGSNIILGYGYRFAKKFAVQFSGGYANSYWAKFTTPAAPSEGHPEYVLYKKTQFAFLRAELAYNIYSSAKDFCSLDNSFSLFASAGCETGMQWKYFQGADQITCHYAGPTAALKFQYNISEGRSIYLEPRVSFINFSVPYNPPYDYIGQEYTDVSYGITAGVEFSLPKSDCPKYGWLYKRDKFKQQVSISAMSGFNYFFIRGDFKGDKYVDSSHSLLVDYMPHSLLGVRLMCDYSIYSFNEICSYTESLGNNVYNYTGLWYNKYHWIGTALDFKFNITNAVYGYNHQRRWSTAFYLGPLLSVNTKLDTKIDKGELTLTGSEVKNSRKRSKGLHWGGHCALNCKYNFAYNWGVFAELGMKIYKNTFMGVVEGDYNPLRAVSFQLGISCDIK